MKASEIAAGLEALHKEFQDGNIGWRNYKEKVEKLFELDVALAEEVAVLELQPKGE